MSYVPFGAKKPIVAQVPTTFSLRLIFVQLIIGMLIGFCATWITIVSYSLYVRNNYSTSNDAAKSNAWQLSDSASVASTTAARTTTPDPDELTIEDTAVADRLYNEVRLTCFVMTTKKQLPNRVPFAHDTWARRCNRVVYMSSLKDKRAENVVVIRGKDFTWGKMRHTLQHLYRMYRNDTDYFLRADDESFIIPENARHMLYPYSPDVALYFGSEFQPPNPRNGTAPKKLRPDQVAAGNFILSRRALVEVVQANLWGTACQDTDTTLVRVALAKCLRDLKIKRGSSLDGQHLERFLTILPLNAMLPKLLPIGDAEQMKQSYLSQLFAETVGLAGVKNGTGPSCCSSLPVSMYPLTPRDFYALDRLLYRVQTYGIVDKHEDPPLKLSPTEMANLPIVKQL